MELIKNFRGAFSDEKLENEYRTAEYEKQIPIFKRIIWITIIPVVLLFFSDISFINDELILIELLIVRLVFALLSIILLFFLRKKRTLKQYDFAISGWIIALAILVLYISFTRPSIYIGYLVIDVVLVLLTYQLLAIRLSIQLFVAASFSLSLFLGMLAKGIPIDSIQLSYFLSFGIANFIGYLIARRQHISHRNQFYLLKTERELKQELEKSVRDKDKLFSIIAHDLKNPLSSILNNSELLVKEYGAMDSKDMYESLLTLNESAKKFEELLGGLLEWVKLQLGKLHIKKTDVLLADITKKVLPFFRQQASTKGIVLQDEISECLIAKVDEDVLKTILRNLISNALKFTKRGGMILISTEEKIDTIEIIVSDTGIGIKEDKLKKLFATINEDISQPGTESEIGNGLGLFLCRELVELHGGELRVFSDAGRGSKFKIILPK